MYVYVNNIYIYKYLYIYRYIYILLCITIYIKVYYIILYIHNLNIHAAKLNYISIYLYNNVQI